MLLTYKTDYGSLLPEVQINLSLPSYYTKLEQKENAELLESGFLSLMADTIRNILLVSQHDTNRLDEYIQLQEKIALRVISDYATLTGNEKLTKEFEENLNEANE